MNKNEKDMVLTCQREDTIISLNLVAMRDLAWDHEFGAKVDTELRVVFDMWRLSFLQNPQGIPPSMNQLVTLVGEALDKESQTAKTAIKRMIDKGYLIVSQDPDDRRKKILTLAPDAQEKYQRVLALHRDIHKAISAQLADPSNLDAGREFVPETIFTNEDFPQ